MYPTTDTATLGLRAEIGETYRQRYYAHQTEARAEVDAQVRREKLHLDKIATILGGPHTWDAKIETRERQIPGPPLPTIPHPILVIDGVQFISNNGREPDIDAYVLCGAGQIYHQVRVRSDVDRAFLVNMLAQGIEQIACEGCIPK